MAGDRAISDNYTIFLFAKVFVNKINYSKKKKLNTTGFGNILLTNVSIMKNIEKI